MKMTNKTIWEGIQTLGAVSEKGKLGYACARNMRKLLDAGKEFMDTRDQFLQEYGDDAGNGKYNFPPEKAEAFANAIREYEEIEHDVDVYQVSEDVFTSGNLTSKHMYSLAWMVKEEE